MLAASLVLAGVLAAVYLYRQEAGSGAGGGSGWTDLAPAEFEKLLARGGVTLVNVHVPYEGEIPGTDLFIPYDRIAEEAGRRLPRRDAPIALYCRSGRMSTSAAHTLASLGYLRVYNLSGGFQSWRAAGFPFVVRQGEGDSPRGDG